ncbi:MAG: hypothetical protein H6719_32375 [Sandaracinaceae bacterium]|nr:hypothetical protein [Sandaracinaceae bacterium]
MARTKKKVATRRGSPEAIAKRRVARALNRLFEETGATESLDGRTLKRKQRLMRELKEGKRGKPLKALEVLAHANELLTLGETLTTLRKLKPKLPPTPPVTEESAAVYVETQKNYGFDPKSWRVLGIDIEKLIAGGGAPAAKPARKAPRKKK